MAECALTELDESMCSHCRGLDDLPKYRPDFEYRFFAQFSGVCDHCGGAFDAGDYIGTDGGRHYFCPRCCDRRR